jgi:2-oxoisovalerate dehydrogenase E1 component
VLLTLPTKPSGMDDVFNAALQIRAFESNLLDLFKHGFLAGTVHTCIGQELCAAALHPHLLPGTDAFFATHRGHGHYLAYGGPPAALLAEMMGREGALCGGRGGTQNLLHQRFFSAGIQGGSAPIAVGFAHALRRRGEPGIAVVQLGDGTLGEGTLYEAFTFAAWLKAPVLFFLEDNGWAQSTDTSTTTPGNVLQRGAGFGLEVSRIDDSSPHALHEHLGKVVAAVREGRPFLQIVRTRRLMAHSKGDDNRPKAQVEALWEADPLAQLVDRDASWRRRLTDAETEVQRLSDAIKERPLLAYQDQPALAPSNRKIDSATLHADASGDTESGYIAEELNKALGDVLDVSRDVVLVGEDLLDPYGGAFKITRGLSTRFPDQVLSTPIAEAGLVGLSNGMALAGMRPVAEIMFADFVTLAADQLINFAAKFYSMYGGRITCPLTLRLVSGGGRGYGPTHSQSLEQLFCGIPGLSVIALSQRHRPGALLRQLILEDEGPKILVENKLLYALRPQTKAPPGFAPEPVTADKGCYPPLVYRPQQGLRPDVTVVTYGAMTGVCEAAMQRLLEEDELVFDYIVMTQLWPLDATQVIESVKRTRRLVVVEESVPTYGISAAIVAAVAEQMPEGFSSRMVGARPIPLPAVRHLEDEILPSVDRVAQAIAACSQRRNG